MSENQTAPQPAIALNDILYVLFRRKWLILSISLLGVCAGVGVLFYYPFPYTSESKLLIRYVQDNANTTITPDSQLHPVDYSGAGVLNSEMEILRSRNVARRAAEVVGPERIMGKGTKLTNSVELAAEYISRYLVPDLPRDDDVITLKFSHTDPTVVQDVLTQVMEAYKEEHKALHMTAGVTEQFLIDQTTIAENQLDETERARHEILMKVGVLSIDDAKTQISGLSGKLQEDILDATADLAQTRATISQMQRDYPQVTNSASADTDAPVKLAPVSPAKVAEYESIVQRLDKLQADQDALLNQVTTNSPLAKVGQIGIDKERATKEKLEHDYPSLLAVAVSHGDAEGRETPQDTINQQILKAQGLTARIAMLTNALANVQSNIQAVAAAEASTTSLTARREAEEESLKHLLTTTQNEHISDANGGHVSNIGTVESPTPPVRDTKKIAKMVWGLMAGSIGFSLALAFGIELFFNRTFRQPIDVQNKLPFPFFVSIPKTTTTRATARLANSMAKLALPPAVGSNGEHAEENGANGNGNRAVAFHDLGEALAAAGDMGKLEPWEQKHALRPFYETLRDRLISYFEMINLTHKPKIVAVTSAHAKAGVTTVATGLAAALSETGEGNVLVVNMNVQEGEAHHFYKGKLQCGLDQVLEKGQREGAQIQENLYVAREGAGNDALRRALPKQFSQMVPKMKASDFDYIIFDMPPVSQISITPRLARFMDMVLMVVESDKTDRDVAKRAAAMLAETKTNVGVVLNKTRSYVPKALQQEL